MVSSPKGNENNFTIQARLKFGLKIDFDQMDLNEQVGIFNPKTVHSTASKIIIGVFMVGERCEFTSVDLS